MRVRFDQLTIPKLHMKGEEKILNLELTSSSLLTLPPSQGKTYLFEHIIGLRKKFLGSILINGVKVDLDLSSGFFDLRKKIGILFEKPVFLSNLNLEQNLGLILRNSSKNYKEGQIQKAIQTALKKFSLADCSQLRPAAMTQNQLKVGAFLMAIIHDPLLFVWDEPHLNFPDEIVPTIKEEIKKIEERGGLLIGLSSSTNFAKINDLKSVAL